MKLLTNKTLLEPYQNDIVRTEDAYCISKSTGYVIDNHNETVHLVINNFSHFIELPYSDKDIILENLKDTACNTVNHYEVLLNGFTYKFAILVESNSCKIISLDTETDTYLKEHDSPDFFKYYVYHYKGFDIEWVGENYQVTNYLANMLVSTSTNLTDVFKDIDHHIEWVKNIPMEFDFYKKYGLHINIVPSEKHYFHSYPYTYEIYNNNILAFPGNGISNVFEYESKAKTKACFRAYFMLKNSGIL